MTFKKEGSIKYKVKVNNRNSILQVLYFIKTDAGSRNQFKAIKILS